MEEVLREAAKVHLGECSRVLVFDEGNEVLYADFPVNKMELPTLAGALGERDAAIKRGVFLQGKRYEVHRHHPPLVYGRNMDGEPEASTGWAVCRVEVGLTGKPCYAAITYEMPQVSARMVPKLQEFCQQVLQPPRQE